MENLDGCSWPDSFMTSASSSSFTAPKPNGTLSATPFPLAVAFDKCIIYLDTFVNNPDYGHPICGTKYGIYEPGCGMDNVMLS
jgi:hypothetical protein